MNNDYSQYFVNYKNNDTLYTSNDFNAPDISHISDVLIKDPQKLFDLGIYTVNDFVDSLENGLFDNIGEIQEAYAVGNGNLSFLNFKSHSNDDNDLDFQQRVVQNFKSIEGSPYRFGGTSLRTGIDCSYAIQYVLKNSGVTDAPRTTFQFLNFGTKVDSLEDAQVGDLIITYSKSSPSGRHIEMITDVTEDGGERHYYTSGARNKRVGVVFNKSFDKSRQKQILSIRRVRPTS